MQATFVSLSPARAGRPAALSGSQLVAKGPKAQIWSSAHNVARADPGPVPGWGGPESTDVGFISALVEDMWGPAPACDRPGQMGLGSGSVPEFGGVIVTADAGMRNTTTPSTFYAPPTMEALSLIGDAELFNVTEFAEATFGPDILDADFFSSTGGCAASGNAPAVDTEVEFSFESRDAFQQHVQAAFQPLDAAEANAYAGADGDEEEQEEAQGPAPEAPEALATAGAAAAGVEENECGMCPGCGKTGLSLAFRGQDNARRDFAWMGSHRTPGRRPGGLKGKKAKDKQRGLHCDASREYRAKYFQSQ